MTEQDGADGTRDGRETAAEAEAPTAAEHPFARFLRTVGRGPSLSRPLTVEEAEQAMSAILRGQAEPVQIGALFLVLRYRKETSEELAGFTRAARAWWPAFAAPAADLDWPSYADRHKQLPYFLLSALLLAETGLGVAMHGLAGTGPATTPAVLAALGIEPARSVEDAAERVRRRRFAYLPLDAFCPPLLRLFQLRPVLGLRTPANSFCRELNPLGAPAQLQGVFHPTYIATHQAAARLLGQPKAAIFKGGGGEAQINPEKPCRIGLVEGESLAEETWPALAPGLRHRWREEPLDPGTVVALWRGEIEAPGPEAAVIGTAAVALKLGGRAPSAEAALTQARALWTARPKSKYGRRH
ncbi:MAG: glycosyl transferase family protein [Pseudomonadota bacterium]